MEIKNELKKEIIETIEKKGNILIPVFSIGRAQEVLINLVEIIHEIKDILINYSVVVEGMIKEINSFYQYYSKYLRKDIYQKIQNNQNFFNDEKIQYLQPKERGTLKSQYIVIATAGMMTGGPILHYFEKNYFDKKNKIIFVGYQAEGSFGSKILSGEKEEVEKILKEKFDKSNTMDIIVKKIDGYSGHATSEELKDMLEKFSKKIKKIFLIHGERRGALKLRTKLKHLKKEIIVPRNMETYLLYS